MSSDVYSTDLHGCLHRPATEPRGAMLLTHGAGSNCHAPLLVALARAFAENGYTVLRYDLPFRQSRSSGPPIGASAGKDRDGLRSAAKALQDIAPGPLYLGGHSYGGRQSTMLAAEEPEVCRALLLLSYPLHPPRKPLELRTAHLPNLQTPSLFVHGTRDPFGSIEEMRAALGMIPAPVAIEVIEGAGHDLGRARDSVAQKALAAFEKLIDPEER